MPMKLKVLIICEKFAPDNSVGAIRMSKLAKYLKINHDCEITVLLRDRKRYEDIGDAKYVDRFIYASESKLCKMIMQIYHNYSSSEKYDERNRREHADYIKNRKAGKNALKILKEYGKSVFTTLYSEYTPRSYCRNAVKEMNRTNNTDNSFDVVISSFGPAASHYIGNRIKTKNNRVYWIADYRDPLAIGEATKGFLRSWGLTFAKRITGKADAYTVASEGFIDCINLRNMKNVHVINNGYDKDDFNGILGDNQKPHSRMRLVYTGALFSGARDISVILIAIKELIEEGRVGKEKIEIIYAGQHKHEFIHQCNKSEIDIQIEAHDVIPKRDALELQNSADLLLISAWNTDGYQGNLPLKMYEYLYVGKPIVCAICGTAGNSEVKMIIDRCNAGFCYEAAYHDRDYQKLKEVILKYYNEFCNNGYVRQFVEGIDKEAVKSYDYENLAEQFYHLIDHHKRYV